MVVLRPGVLVPLYSRVQGSQAEQEAVAKDVVGARRVEEGEIGERTTRRVVETSSHALGWSGRVDILEVVSAQCALFVLHHSPSQVGLCTF